MKQTGSQELHQGTQTHFLFLSEDFPKELELYLCILRTVSEDYCLMLYFFVLQESSALGPQ